MCERGRFTLATDASVLERAAGRAAQTLALSSSPLPFASIGARLSVRRATLLPIVTRPVRRSPYRLFLILQEFVANAIAVAATETRVRHGGRTVETSTRLDPVHLRPSEGAVRGREAGMRPSRLEAAYVG